MKKFISFSIMILIIFSIVIVSTSYGADYTSGTEVTYTGEADTAYEISVPAVMSAGGTGTVYVAGTWPSDDMLAVSSDPRVTVTNSLDSTEQRDLDVNFDGIYQPGNNISSVSASESISVGTMSALYGVWSGTFDYVVGFGNTNEENFSDNTWTQIIQSVKTNNVPDTWNVGDVKTMLIDGDEYEVVIIGKNHDTYADGSGTAPLTFQLLNCYKTMAPMIEEPFTISEDGGQAIDTTLGGWKESDIRNKTLPEIMSKMPKEVQSAISEVKKTSYCGYKAGDDDWYAQIKGDVEVTNDKLFLLAWREIWSWQTSMDLEGTQYEYYANGGSSAKTRNGSANDWWLRSVLGLDTFWFADAIDGEHGGLGPATACGISFAFCF